MEYSPAAFTAGFLFDINWHIEEKGLFAVHAANAIKE